MRQTEGRRQALTAMLSIAALFILSISGCGGGDPDQRKSGTLVVPLDSVEKAGEQAGKREDAAKGTTKK